MAKRHHRRGGRTTPKGTRPHESRRAEGEPPFTADAAARLREPSPFGLLAMASGLIEVTTPRPLDDWPGSPRERPDGPSVFLSFAQSGLEVMGPLALAVAVMLPDRVLAERVRAEVDPRLVADGPPWLAWMDGIEITGTWLQGHVLGDGENVVVAWRWRDGSAATAIVYVDHNMGTIVKDAFVVPEEGVSLLAAYARDEPEGAFTVSLDPAAARARIVEAIEAGERTVPPLETDSWPSCRPMLEWVLRRLPVGGRGYERPDWSEAERADLLDEFVASAHGSLRGLGPDEVRSLAEPLVWFACDYGPGDPLRWSPVSVEIVLADWYPRKVFGLPAEELARVPDVLAGFVRFAHERTAVTTPLTVETVEAVARWRSDFLAAIRRPDRGPVANATLLARIAAGFDPDEFDDDLDTGEDDDLASMADEIEAALVDLVGGRDAYDAITDTPLEDVAFEWMVVPEGLHAPVAEVLAQLDRWASELFDDEVRTIARAVLAGVVAADQATFNRSLRTDALAAAILAYLMGRLTGRMSSKERRQLPWSVFTQQELAVATGVSASTISSRGRTVGNVVARAEIDWPSLLHSIQRREVIETRQRIAEWRADQA